MGARGLGRRSYYRVCSKWTLPPFLRRTTEGETRWGGLPSVVRVSPPAGRVPRPSRSNGSPKQPGSLTLGEGAGYPTIPPAAPVYLTRLT